MTDAFADAVERKIERIGQMVARGDHADGRLKTPAEIIEEMADEQVDTVGWSRLLDGYPMTAEQQGMIDTIVSDASLLWDAIERLKATYGEG